MPKKAKWGELPCPECKEPVAWNATRCPHCQTSYSAGQIEGRKRAHKSSEKWGIGCLGLIGLLLIGTCASGNEQTEESTNLSSSEASAEIPKAGSADAATTAAVKKFNDDIMTALSGCDAAGTDLAERSGGLTTGATSVYEAYALAARVEDACRESWSRVGDVRIPAGLSQVASRAAEKTRETCENAMVAKQMGGEAMKEVFDGDMRPSKVEDARRKSETAQAGTLACVAGIFNTALKAGVDVSVIGEDK